jgi:hypothetical protein
MGPHAIHTFYKSTLCNAVVPCSHQQERLLLLMAPLDPARVRQRREPAREARRHAGVRLVRMRLIWLRIYAVTRHLCPNLPQPTPTVAQWVLAVSPFWGSWGRCFGGGHTKPSPPPFCEALVPYPLFLWPGSSLSTSAIASVWHATPFVAYPPHACPYGARIYTGSQSLIPWQTHVYRYDTYDTYDTHDTLFPPVYHTPPPFSFSPPRARKGA